MPKISEMSLEELQDYAVQLENERTSLQGTVTAKDEELSDLRALNTNLQKRNNELFKQVEQQVPGQNDNVQGEPEPTVSCEEMARTRYKEIIK